MMSSPSHLEGSETTSLAGNFAVQTSNDNNKCSFALFAIDQVTQGKDILADGAKSMNALVSTASSASLTPNVVLTCTSDNDHKLSVSMSKSNDQVEVDSDLLEILQRILIQWTVSQLDSDDKSEWTISIVNDDTTISLDMSSETGVEKSTPMRSKTKARSVSKRISTKRNTNASTPK